MTLPSARGAVSAGHCCHTALSAVRTEQFSCLRCLLPYLVRILQIMQNVETPASTGTGQPRDGAPRATLLLPHCGRPGLPQHLAHFFIYPNSSHSCQNTSKYFSRVFLVLLKNTFPPNEDISIHTELTELKK